MRGVRFRVGLRLTTVAVLVVGVVGFAVVGAAGAAPAPKDSGKYGGGRQSTFDEQGLPADELERQLAAGRRLQTSIAATNRQLAMATARLKVVSDHANEVLQAHATAVEQAQLAHAEKQHQLAIERALSAQLARDRRTLADVAYRIYADGEGALGDLGRMIDLLGASPQEASGTAAQLAYLGDRRGDAVRQLQATVQAQAAAARAADAASDRAETSAQRAAAAKREVEAAVADQRRELDVLRDRYATQVAESGPIAGLLLGSSDRRAAALSRELMAAGADAGALGSGARVPCSANVGAYPNGQFPESALCPLYGAKNQRLRPAAAAAFNAMSRAYLRDTGSPLCVTDSYRSYDEQVRIKATRGRWAATPGTSNHGRGLAVDLCGGVASFGSPAHLWLRQNAPLYGWFHPAWAEPSGALPEPWHWEYAA